ncbi:unnamed protein product [Alternaria alternata]
MASDDQGKHARDLHADLIGSFGDYPPWSESDIAEMLQQGVDPDHIETEWAHVTVAGWITNGLSEEMIRLEYIRSVPEPNIDDAAMILEQLSFQTRSNLPLPLSKEDILVMLTNGYSGERIAQEYAAGQYNTNLFSLTEDFEQDDGDELERSWIELHYGLLYATTQLPSMPVVLRNMHRSQDQYNTYFAPAPGIDPIVFSACTVRLATTTVMKLDKILNQRIKEGGHPKALNTMFTSDDLTAFRAIRWSIKGDDVDVENHSQVWQFLMGLAAKLHPHLAESQEEASVTVQPTKTAKRRKFDLKKWTDAERHALWRCINAWCKKHGVDKFEAKNLDTDTLQNFANSINAMRASRDEGSDRTPETVQGQVRDAIRRDVSVANRPIFDLGERAKKMAEDIRNNRVIPDSVRYPDEAIDMSGIP